MFTPKTKLCFDRILRFGCFCRLLPYRWNSSRLTPSTSCDLRIFKMHRNIVYIYTVFMIVRVVHASLFADPFPIQQRTISCLWMLFLILTSVGFAELQKWTDDIMNFANGLISGAPEFLEVKSKYTISIHRIYAEQPIKYLSLQMTVAIFSVLVSPFMHNLMIWQAPCSPNFVSSIIFSCESMGDSGQDAATKFLTNIFEFYITCTFTFVFNFYWNFNIMGMSLVFTELSKIERNK